MSAASTTSAISSPRRPVTSIRCSAVVRSDFTVGGARLAMGAVRVARQDHRERAAARRLSVPAATPKPVQRAPYGEDFDSCTLPGAIPIAVTGNCTTGLPIFNADGSVDNTPVGLPRLRRLRGPADEFHHDLSQDVIEPSVTGTLAGDLGRRSAVRHRRRLSRGEFRISTPIPATTLIKTVRT